MTVFQCQKQDGQDYCFVKLEMNGQFLLQAPKPRAEIAEKGKSCKASASFNPPYLSEFPGVDRVIQGMKVSDRRETFVRSMGAFYQLTEVINVLAGPRASSGYMPDDSAIVQCGTLVPQPVGYAVERTANQVMVKIQNEPRPLVATFRPDGKLAGPGPVLVASRVVVGSSGGGMSAPGYEEQTHTTTQERQISAADVPNYNSDAVHQNGMEYSVSEPVTTTTYEPTAPTPKAPTVITAPKTERCSAGVMPGAPSVTMGNLVGNALDPSGKRPPAPVGLRMHGTYAAAGGLSIEFRSDTATVECGEAHVAEAYTVQSSGAQTQITVQNAGTPFTLQMQPNGSLVGSGMVNVAGRGHRLTRR